MSAKGEVAVAKTKDTLTYTTVLRLKIVEADTSNGYCSKEDLDKLACICRHGWNAAIEDWLLRQRGMPESEKQARPGRVKESLGEATKLYHAVGSRVPSLFGTQTAVTVARNVWSYLQADADWRLQKKGAKKIKRRDLILAYDSRPPFSAAKNIPTYGASTKVNFADSLTVSFRRLTRESGVTTIKVSSKKLPKSHKALLREMAEGTRKVPDSKLVFRNDHWYMHIPVRYTKPKPKQDVVAHLYPVIGNPDNQDRMYNLYLPGREDKVWKVGDGRYLRSQVSRLVALRKHIGWRYRQRQGAGHGRKKVDAAVVKRWNQQRNQFYAVRQRAILDIVKQCQKYDVGTLIYHEPTGPLKNHCWFSTVKLDWDWTSFLMNLRNSLAHRYIDLSVKKWKLGEAKKALPDSFDSSSSSGEGSSQ